MKDLEWTDEPPEEPGFYLIKRWDGIKRHWVSAAAHVFDTDQGLRFWQTGVSGSSFGQDVHRDGTKWAGPIPEPE